MRRFLTAAVALGMLALATPAHAELLRVRLHVFGMD